MMKISDLRKKSVEDLHKLVVEKNRELMNLRFQKVAGELQKTHQVRLIRRAVARMLTLQREVRSNKKG